jgi:PiT family inorganic phosphate transporter
MHSDVLLVIVVGAALCFDFTNGFHDTANVVAPAISTRSLAPRIAVGLAAVLNFVGALISLKVAATIATGIIDTASVSETVAFAALAGAISWNLLTWVFGLPSSSSHALIGGVVGAMLAATGGGIKWHGLITKVVVPALVSPLVAFLVAAVMIVLLYRLVAYRRPGPVRGVLRGGQIVASALLAFAHGTNDAQKTMGLISVALVAHGDISTHHFHVPLWVVLSAASAMALGTYAGGWRIIRTVGTRIIKMDSAQGLSAQVASAVVILLSSHLGYPLSSTQVIGGGVVGAGAAKRLSAVRWGVAGNIVAAWVITLPMAGLVGAGAYALVRLFGSGATGAVVISAVALVVLGRAIVVRRGALRAPSRPVATEAP